MNDIIKKAMSMLGKRSADKLSKSERVERAKKAAEARWSKPRE